MVKIKDYYLFKTEYNEPLYTVTNFFLNFL